MASNSKGGEFYDLRIFLWKMNEGKLPLVRLMDEVFFIFSKDLFQTMRSDKSNHFGID